MRSHRGNYLVVAAIVFVPLGVAVKWNTFEWNGAWNLLWRIALP